ncbi:hypothetical protein SAMN05421874_105221 [Nonomuraea maritima]|uniref:PPE family protein n=1 Tax=Nonomuraea maritima TaxID=683260 RepID=A0A1G8ZCS7_9ACTN|nr:hypothetical protein [Nonomuraea maritima]SDK12871.1 hypothetical protein SAMN05421874_105221 [Nonomuraea maritima]
MYVDPPAPRAREMGEQPPIAPAGPLDAPQRAWQFNPDYQRLVEAWNAVMPHLDTLSTALDKAYSRAKSPQTWDAPVGERYVEDIREWRNRLDRYRHSVLTAISDEAADTPRWVQTAANAPHAFP